MPISQTFDKDCMFSYGVSNDAIFHFAFAYFKFLSIFSRNVFLQENEGFATEVLEPNKIGREQSRLLHNFIDSCKVWAPLLEKLPWELLEEPSRPELANITVHFCILKQ